MSIWTRIWDAVQSLASGEGMAQLFDRLRTPPERTVGFTIAVIALGAKMAKADGMVTRDEVTAFREVFHIAPEDEAHAARVFNLARQDVAGFEEYAGKIAAMFRSDSSVLGDLMEGLFHIAVADGRYLEVEDSFLRRVAEIFGLPEPQFRGLRARFVPDAAPDPYSVLGVSPTADLDEVRRAWRRAVRESHPDQMVGRGLPEEAIKLAEKRMTDINRAWDEISRQSAS